jgi:hypothetical protein
MDSIGPSAVGGLRLEANKIQLKPLNLLWRNRLSLNIDEINTLIIQCVAYIFTLKLHKYQDTKDIKKIIISFRSAIIARNNSEKAHEMGINFEKGTRLTKVQKE